jgi:hypothetical protein
MAMFVNLTLAAASREDNAQREAVLTERCCRD